MSCNDCPFNGGNNSGGGGGINPLVLVVGLALLLGFTQGQGCQSSMRPYGPSDRDRYRGPVYRDAVVPTPTPKPVPPPPIPQA
jgi:hypothetical protein